MKTLKVSEFITAALVFAWLAGAPANVLAQHHGKSGHDSRGGFTLGKINGVFTVTEFKAVNGVSQATGWLTADLIDSGGVNRVGAVTNFPVRMPVAGLLSGKAIEVGTFVIDDPAVLPQLSTNTCVLLGVVIGAIDITLPGLGLSVHVNEISLIVRADRETTVGDLLCTLLGDDLLGAAPVVAQSTARTAEGRLVAPAAVAQKVLTLEQLRGMLAIALGPGVATSGKPSGSAELSAAQADPRPRLVQDLVRQVITTIKGQPFPGAAK